MTPAERKRKMMHRNPSFDVTCVIGTVSLMENGDGPTPAVAAFQLIAEHDAPGQYTFPMPNGDTCRVTVDHEETQAVRV